MQREQQNIYKTARLGSGLTQEAAAEALNLSVESVRAYETGRTVPLDETVLLMVETYGAEWLRVAHGHATDVLDLIPDISGPVSVAEAVLMIVSLVQDFADQQLDRRLMQIGRDNFIDETEEADFFKILGYLSRMSAAGLVLRCCTGAKKERPEAGTSKRSRSQGIPENNRKTIISGIPRTSSEICAGKAVI